MAASVEKKKKKVYPIHEVESLRATNGPLCMTTPLFEHFDVLRSMRDTCARAASHWSIEINQDAMHSFVSTLQAPDFAREKLQHGLRFPLRFPSFMQELNFVAVLAMLNGFSGYRAEFHKHTGHGAYDAVRRMVMGLYLAHDDAESEPLEAKSLKNVSAAKLAQALNVPTHIETPHPTLPGVVVGMAGGPLHEPLEMAAKMCTDTAEFLQEHACKDLASYLVRVCEQAAQFDDVESHILLGLAQLSSFRDVFEDDGQPVYLLKKALFLVHAMQELVTKADRSMLPAPLSSLAHRWSNHQGQALPMFVDNVIPTMLTYFGILKFQNNSGALASWTPQPQAPVGGDDRRGEPVEGPHLEHLDACYVRAAALAAGAQIIEYASSQGMEWMHSMTEEQLDAYLWTNAKRPEYRRIPRLVEKRTGMY